jgi:hypothetical protein
MRVYVAFAMLGAALLGSCADTRGVIRIEQATAGATYNLIVHVKNIPDYDYNPKLPTDRAQMAAKLIRGQCPHAELVGQQTINTEIYGITSSKPDYVVFVRCSPH